MKHLSRLGASLVVVACSGTARSAAPTETLTPIDPPSSTTPHETTAPAPNAPQVVDSPPAPPPAKTQPAHIKLKLGHFKNAKRGIGVTIDQTEVIDNVAKIPPAKLRFDGETKVWRLEGSRSSERNEFKTDKGGLMLQVWKDGHYSVYVPDPDTDKWSDEIVVTRDGDADPL
jgi:hypothetical protein